MHPRLHPAGCIIPCIIVQRISQLNPHVLIQSMRISFCIYRLIKHQNSDYNHQMRVMDARNGLFCVILSDRSFHCPTFFSLLMAAFRGRNQKFIMECTLLWTIAGHRPQCEVSSKVSQNNESRSLHHFTSQPWSFAGGKSFKYSVIENRLLHRLSSLFADILFVYCEFSHVPPLLPPNAVLSQFNSTSPLLFLICGRESRQKTYIRINSCHFIGKSPSDIACVLKDCSNAF